MSIFLGLAAGFLVGFFVPTRAMVLCLVAVAVIGVNVGYAMLVHQPISMLGILVGMITAYPAAFSINRFMHD